MSYYYPQAPYMGTVPLPVEAAYASPPVTPRSLPNVSSPLLATPANMPRAMPSAYAYPSPSSPASRPLPGTTAINPHIQAVPGHQPQSVWDVRTPPQHAQNAHRQLLDLNMPAFAAGTAEVSLTFSMSPAPRPVRVVASNGHSITIRDVFTAIYAAMAAPIDPSMQVSHIKAARLAGGRVVHLLESSVRFLGLRAMANVPLVFEVLFGPQ